MTKPYEVNDLIRILPGYTAWYNERYTHGLPIDPAYEGTTGRIIDQGTWSDGSPLWSVAMSGSYSILPLAEQFMEPADQEVVAYTDVDPFYTLVRELRRNKENTHGR